MGLVSAVLAAAGSSPRAVPAGGGRGAGDEDAADEDGQDQAADRAERRGRDCRQPSAGDEGGRPAGI